MYTQTVSLELCFANKGERMENLAYILLLIGSFVCTLVVRYLLNIVLYDMSFGTIRKARIKKLTRERNEKTFKIERLEKKIKRTKRSNKRDKLTQKLYDLKNEKQILETSIKCLKDYEIKL